MQATLYQPKHTPVDRSQWP
jgi:Xaa-Pro dipeptidase